MSKVALGIGLGWAIVAWCLALLAPYLAFWPGVELLHVVLPGVTIGLIVYNLVVALRVLRRGISPLALLPNTIVQVALFTALFLQIAAHQGAEYYRFERAPTPADWVGFSLAHAARASDVLDTIEAYGWKIQAIRHDSRPVGVALVAYHFVVNVFVLTLLWAFSRRAIKAIIESNLLFETLFDLVAGRTPEEREERAWAVGVVVFLVWLLAWVLMVFWLRPWNLVDVPLWFVDNVFRLVDCVDAMDSFEWRLHAVPREWPEATLTFFFRVFVAIGLAILFASFRAAAPTIPAVAPVSHPVRVAFGFLVVLVGAFLVSTRMIHPEDSVRALVAAARGDNEPQARLALSALRRVGIGAEYEALGLARTVRKLPAERQLVAIRTLGYLGPGYCTLLGKLACGAEEPVALAALESLAVSGPHVGPELVRAWKEGTTPAVRTQAGGHLEVKGVEVVPGLMEATTEATLADHLHWIKKLDRNWTLRVTENYLARRAQRMTTSIANLAGWTLESRYDAVENLETLGPLAVEALPALHQLLTRSDKPLSLRWKTARTIVKVAPQEQDHPRVRAVVQEHLDQFTAPKSDDERRDACKELTKLGSAARVAVPALSACLTNNDSDLRKLTIEALASIGPTDVVVPLLVKRLTDSDRGVQLTAVQALGKLGARPDIGVPFLIELLRDRDWKVRGEAIKILPAYGPAAKAAVEPLIQLVREPTAFCREGASALGRIGAEPERVIPVLISLLQPNASTLSPESAEGVEAARALGHFGPAAREALPAIRQILEREWDMLGTRADLQEVIRRIEGWYDFQP